MKILPVVIIAIACYAAGMMHGQWLALSRIENYLNLLELNYKQNERTLDRKIPSPNFI